jgi:hypothetical protein
MKSHNIIFTKEITDGRIDGVIDHFDYIAHHSNSQLILNFENVQNIDACGYAILCCLSDVLCEQRIQSKLDSLVGPIEKEFLENILIHKAKTGFLPIREMQIETSEILVKGVELAIDPSFTDLLDHKFQNILSEDKLWHVRLILHELMQNSLDHSTSERYFMYAGVAGNHFQFGVLDMGVSIPAKLEGKYQCDSDIEYIEKSLEYEIGTRRSRHGGLGLNHMFNILKGQKGRLVLLSRYGQLRRYFKSRKQDKKQLKIPLRGTWCMARIPID